MFTKMTIMFTKMSNVFTKVSKMFTKCPLCSQKCPICSQNTHYVHNNIQYVHNNIQYVHKNVQYVHINVQYVYKMSIMFTKMTIMFTKMTIMFTKMTIMFIHPQKCPACQKGHSWSCMFVWGSGYRSFSLIFLWFYMSFANTDLTQCIQFHLLRNVLIFTLAFFANSLLWLFYWELTIEYHIAFLLSRGQLCH